MPVTNASKPTHWSFQPVRRPELSYTRNRNWARNPIDYFVLARFERKGIDPSPEAPKTTLIRRLFLDLTGLPPSPADVNEFLTDTLNYTHIRPSWSAESRFGINLDVALRTDAIAAEALPAIIGNIGFGSEVGNAKVQDLDGSTKSGEEVIAITRGRHSIKMGGIYEYRIVNRYGPGNADYSYASVADFLTNTPASITFTFGTKPFSIRTWQLGGFVQDDFKVSRNLS